MRSISITKSDFIRFLQCPRYAWLWKHHPELRGESDQTNRYATQGKEVELFARKLFPKGTEVKGIEEGSFAQTKTLMRKGAKVLYQATAETGKYYAKADILVRDDDAKRWHLYEVKASTSIKEDYLADLYFQWLAFEAAGIKLASIQLILINGDYVFHAAEGIRPEKLFSFHNLTADLPALEIKWNGQIAIAHRILTAKTEPRVLVLNKSIKKEMSEAMIQAYWKGIPEYSIYRVAYITRSQLVDLIGRGILDMRDIPDDYFLTERLARQVRITKERMTYLDKEGLKAELKKIHYPLYFLDYETVAPAIPWFEGNKPYQNLPFQYSLHVVEKPGAKPKHFDCVHDRKSDPAPHLLKSLRSHIGDKGTVIAWNAAFERRCNEEMAQGQPDYQSFVDSVNSRLYDLAEPFRNQYIDYRFKGSASLKNVLPVLAPELSYNTLSVHNGEMAVQWLTNLLGRKFFGRSKLLKELKEYCSLDTYAMVRLFEVLRKTAEGL